VIAFVLSDTDPSLFESETISQPRLAAAGFAGSLFLIRLRERKEASIFVSGDECCRCEVACEI